MESPDKLRDIKIYSQEKEKKEGLFSLNTQKLPQQNQVFVNQHLQFHINNIPLVYIQWNSDFCLETWSDQAEKVFGWSFEELSDTTVYESPLVHKDDLDKFNFAVIEAMEKRVEQFRFMIRSVSKSGKILYCEWYNSMLRDDSGKVLSVLSFINDISKRVAYEREIKRANSQLKHIFSSIRDCIWCMEKGEGYLEQKYVSPSITTITGFSIKHISRSWNNWLAIIHPDDRQLIQEYYEKAFSGEYGTYEMEYRVLHTDGSVRWVSDDIKIRKKGKKLLFYGLLRDVTHKVESQKKIEESEKRLRKIAASAPGILYQHTRTRDGKDKFNYMSRESGALIGVPGAVINRGILELWELMDEQDTEVVKNKIESSAENLSSYEHEFKIAIQNQIHWLKAVGHPEANPDESVTWTGIMMDITEQKKNVSDLERRNFELNNFAYKVSHDLRAPLCSVKGLIALIKQGNDPASFSRYLDMIEGSIDRLDQFILNVLSHTRVANSTASASEINFEEIINAIFLDLNYMPSYDKVEKIIDLKTKGFYSDENLIKEIFKNLISNGIKYQDQKKDNSFISIEVENNAERVLITYKDNGLGIEEGRVSKVFDMFYRASEQATGSGIGLYIVQQAIKKMQGKIEVQSKINEGTTFSIVLPNKK